MIDQSTLHDESHKAVLVKSCRKHVRSIFNTLVARLLFFFFFLFFFFYVSALVTKRPPTILLMTNEQTSLNSLNQEFHIAKRNAIFEVIARGLQDDNNNDDDNENLYSE